MMIKILRCLAACILLMSGSVTRLMAQDERKAAAGRCGVIEVMENSFKKNPALKARFQLQTQDIQQTVIKRKSLAHILRTEGAITYVPVVFHIVLTNPSLVTDAQLQAQIDQLNKDYAGLNGDSSKIPAAFKHLFAKTHIQFKLAQRTPEDVPSNGITRTTTTHSSFSITDNSVKYTSSGGADAWDHNRFYNVWITNLSQGYLGYATFPGSSVAAEDGVVIHYTSLPGGTSPYNMGRTLVHETGHYFYLYHIWGDENACSGTDYIDDTPNQGTFTSGCPGAPVKDQCTDTLPGILYEDFMDYTDDACMVMFTNDQVTRMEASLSTYRSSLFTSNGADPVVEFTLDASAKSINTPIQRVCSATFSPVITLRNRGANTISSATIYASIDGGVAASTTSWTGSLATFNETAVSLKSLTITQGTHTLTVIVSKPNGATDDNSANDTLTTVFQYYPAVTPPVTQNFSSPVFPPAGWDIINPDLSYTWERTTVNGNACAVMPNQVYMANGEKDYLRMPVVKMGEADSAWLTFKVAAAVSSDPASSVPFDTLEVLVSTDCGATYSSVYKKWGSSLITRNYAFDDSFVPTADEWRKDSVNLTGYINDSVMIAFLNTNEYENNIYLDDINVYTVTLNKNLKDKKFMITPNPTTGGITIQFYPNPGYVKAINIFDISGQKVATQIINSMGRGSYYFDLTRVISGMYIVQVVTEDKVLTQKVIKR
jgi:hypothetical protein